MSDLSYVRNNDGTYSKLVQLSGSNVPDAQALPARLTSKVTISTLLNAVSVGAGQATAEFDLGATSEQEIWLLINIDQQPWTLSGGVPWSTGAGFATTVFYPNKANVTTTHANIAVPTLTLYLGNYPTGIDAGPSSLDVARRGYLMPPMSGVKGKITNNGTGTATVTVRVLRVWR